MSRAAGRPARLTSRHQAHEPSLSSRALFRSFGAALASNSRALLARSSESGRARAGACDAGCPAVEPAIPGRSPRPGRSHSAWANDPSTSQSRAVHHALVTPDSLFAVACPAPLRVPCASEPPPRATNPGREGEPGPDDGEHDDSESGEVQTRDSTICPETEKKLLLKKITPTACIFTSPARPAWRC